MAGEEKKVGETEKDSEKKVGSGEDEGGRKREDSSSSSSSRLEAELKAKQDVDALRSELIRERKLREEKEKALKEREDKELAEQGKFKELAEKRQKELEETHKSYTTRLERTATRSEVARILSSSKYKLDADVAGEVAKLVDVSGVKINDDGTFVGLEDAIEKHKKSAAQLYSRLEKTAEKRGKKMKGEDEEEEEEEEEKNRDEDEDEENEDEDTLRSKDRRKDKTEDKSKEKGGKKGRLSLKDLWPGVTVPKPTKEQSQIVHVRDMTPAQYAEYKKNIIQAEKRRGGLRGLSSSARNR